MANSEQYPKRIKPEEHFQFESFNFSRVKSLQFMAAVRLILSTGNYEICKDHLRKIPLPERLHPFLIRVAKTIFEEKLNWKYYLRGRMDGYVENMVWSKMGIGCVSTARYIISMSTYSDREKFQLACHFCFEDEILRLGPKVMSDSFLEYVIPDLQYQPMVYVWLSDLKSGIDNKYRELLYQGLCKGAVGFYPDESKNFMVCFLLLYTCRFNHRALCFMWDKLNTYEKERLLYNDIVSIPFELVYYAYPYLSWESQQHILDKGVFIKSLSESNYCDDYFVPIVNKIWIWITPKVFCYILLVVLTKFSFYELPCNANEFYVTMFKKVWQSAPEHLKSQVFNSEFHYDCRCAVIDRVLELDWCKYFDVVDIFLGDRAPSEKKYVLYLPHFFMYKCKELLLRDEWDILEKFLSFCLSTDEELDNFKEKLVKYSVVRAVAVDSAMKQNVDKIDRLMDWFFKTDNDKIKLRAQIDVLYHHYQAVRMQI